MFNACMLTAAICIPWGADTIRSHDIRGRLSSETADSILENEPLTIVFGKTMAAYSRIGCSVCLAMILGQIDKPEAQDGGISRKDEALYHGLPSSFWAEAIRRNRGDVSRGMPPEVLRKYAAILGPNAESWKPRDDLKRIRDGDPEAIPVLRELVRSLDELVAYDSATALGNCTSSKTQAAQILLDALQKTKSNYAIQGIFNAIRKLDRNVSKRKAIPILISRLSGDNVSWAAPLLLAQCGSDAKGAIQPLYRILRSVPKEWSNAEIAAAILRIDPSNDNLVAKEALLRDLKSSDEHEQFSALDDLAELGHLAVFALPSLLDLQKQENERPVLKERIKRALQKILKE